MFKKIIRDNSKIKFFIIRVDFKDIDSVVYETYKESGGLVSLISKSISGSQTKTQNEANAWVLRGLQYEDKGDYEYAIECYKNALMGGDRDKEIWNNIGLAYYQKGDFSNADSALNEALQIDPKYGIAWETKGYLYAMVNQLDEAIEYLNKALDYGEKKSNIWITLGIIHSSKLKMDEAIEAFKNALKIDSNNVNSLNNLGISYQLLSKLREERESIEILEKAASCFEKALQIDPKKAEIWNNYGVVLGFLGKHKSGLSALDKAIVQAPRYAHAYFNRARIYLQIGDKEKALSELKTAVTIDGSIYKDALEDLTLKKLKNTLEFKALKPIE